ncbi:MAG TPA: SWIB/MDM2 domain-containing protein [Gemmatimonadaceae bacterium]
MATRKKSSARKSSGRKSSKSRAKKSGARKKTARKSTARKKTARKSAARKKTARKSTGRKTKKRRTGAKRAPNPAFMKPMSPSSELAAVVGSSPMPRTEVTKRLWSYIKRRGLQDDKNRRMINADDNLRPIFGGKRQVSMFDMTRMVNQHLS